MACLMSARRAGLDIRGLVAMFWSLFRDLQAGEPRDGCRGMRRPSEGSALDDYTVERFDADLAMGKYTSIGSYPLFFLTHDGAALSVDAAREHADEIRDAIRNPDPDHSGWRVVGHDVNWEDPNLFCDVTGERIESAYAESDSGSG